LFLALSSKPAQQSFLTTSSAFRALVILDSGGVAASEDHQTIARISRFVQSRYSTSAVRANHVIIKNIVTRITRFAHSA
jgi:hypothetical protein